MDDNSNVPNCLAPGIDAMCESMSETQPDSLLGTSPLLARFAETRTEGAETVRCPKCGSELGTSADGHCRICGGFLHANTVAMKHGGRSNNLRPRHESRRAELRASVWNELGGTVPPIIAEVAEDFVSACILRSQLAEYLEEGGALNQRGSRRAAVDLYLAMSARVERLSGILCAFRRDAKPELGVDRVLKITRTIINPQPWDE